MYPDGHRVELQSKSDDKHKNQTTPRVRRRSKTKFNDPGFGSLFRDNLAWVMSAATLQRQGRIRSVGLTEQPFVAVATSLVGIHALCSRSNYCSIARFGTGSLSCMPSSRPFLVATLHTYREYISSWHVAATFSFLVSVFRRRCRAFG